MPTRLHVRRLTHASHALPFVCALLARASQRAWSASSVTVRSKVRVPGGRHSTAVSLVNPSVPRRADRISGSGSGRTALAAAKSLAGSASCVGIAVHLLARRPAKSSARHPRRTQVRAEEMVSPFVDGAQVGKEKLPLTLENVEIVLDDLRPYLQKDGGDCAVVDIEGPILRLEMQGSCATCSSSAITLKNGIERTMLDRIPELAEVEAVMPGFKVPTEQGVQAILDTISPFISSTGGTIELVELEQGEGINAVPSIVLGLTGPAQRNTSVKAEVFRRVKFHYGQAEVEIIGDEDLD